MEFRYNETLLYKGLQKEIEIEFNKVYLKKLRFMKRITKKDEINKLNRLTYEIEEIKKIIYKLESKLFYY
jgi:hypothetical protein